MTDSSQFTASVQGFGSGRRGRNKCPWSVDIRSFDDRSRCLDNWRPLEHFLAYELPCALRSGGALDLDAEFRQSRTDLSTRQSLVHLSIQTLYDTACRAR